MLLLRQQNLDAEPRELIETELAAQFFDSGTEILWLVTHPTHHSPHPLLDLLHAEAAKNSNRRILREEIDLAGELKKLAPPTNTTDPTDAVLEHLAESVGPEQNDIASLNEVRQYLVENLPATIREPIFRKAILREGAPLRARIEAAKSGCAESAELTAADLPTNLLEFDKASPAARELLGLIINDDDVRRETLACLNENLERALSVIAPPSTPDLTELVLFIDDLSGLDLKQLESLFTRRAELSAATRVAAACAREEFVALPENLRSRPAFILTIEEPPVLVAVEPVVVPVPIEAPVVVPEPIEKLPVTVVAEPHYELALAAREPVFFIWQLLADLPVPDVALVAVLAKFEMFAAPARAIQSAHEQLNSFSVSPPRNDEELALFKSVVAALQRASRELPQIPAKVAEFLKRSASGRADLMALDAEVLSWLQQHQLAQYFLVALIS